MIYDYLLTGHSPGIIVVISIKTIMAKITLKKNADVKKVAAHLRKKGYIIKQQLPDGSFVIYKKPIKQ